MHFVLLRQAESQTRDVVSMRRDSTVQTQPESLRQTYQDMVDPIVDDSQPFQRSESPEEEILTRCSVGWCSGVADYTVEQEFASPDFSEGDLPSQQDVPAAPAASAGSVRPLGRFRFLHLNSRPTKYGLCTSCGIARKLHLVKSGRAAGQIWVRCGNFWVRGNDWQAIMLAWSSLAWRCSTVCFEASSKVETRSSMAITAWTANEEMKKKSLVLMDLRDRSDTYTNRWLEM